MRRAPSGREDQHQVAGAGAPSGVHPALDVVKRAGEGDPLRLAQERLELRAALLELEAVDAREPRGGARIGPAARREIGADPRAEILRLSDIEQAILGVEETVGAGPVRDRGEVGRAGPAPREFHRGGTAWASSSSSSRVRALARGEFEDPQEALGRRPGAVEGALERAGAGAEPRGEDGEAGRPARKRFGAAGGGRELVQGEAGDASRRATRRVKAACERKKKARRLRAHPGGRARGAQQAAKRGG